MKRIRVLIGTLWPGDLVLVGDASTTVRTIIDANLIQQGRSWHELPPSNILARPGGASVQRWPYATTGFPTWRP